MSDAPARTAQNFWVELFLAQEKIKLVRGRMQKTKRYELKDIVVPPQGADFR